MLTLMLALAWFSTGSSGCAQGRVDFEDVSPVIAQSDVFTDLPIMLSDHPVVPDGFAVDGPSSGLDTGSSCSGSQTLCNGSCVELTRDNTNCGSCGTSCPAGGNCVAGHCTDAPCPAPRMCNGVCIDITSDPMNCGGCGIPCPTGYSCVMSRCTNGSCTAPQAMCSGGCVDITSDPMNCGGCGILCPAGYGCVMSRCTGTGEPGAPCSVDSDCSAGSGTAGCIAAIEGWTGGSCTRTCTSTADCGARGVCIGTTNSGSYCYVGCSSSSDCRAGYLCVAYASGKACTPDCNTDPAVVCFGAGLCDRNTGLCSFTCSSDDLSHCSPGSTCMGGQCACTDSTICGANRRCYPSTGLCGCASDAACGTGHTCNVSTGTCSL